MATSLIFFYCAAGEKTKGGGGGLSMPFGKGAGGGAVEKVAGTRLRPGVPLPTWICDTVQVLVAACSFFSCSVQK